MRLFISALAIVLVAAACMQAVEEILPGEDASHPAFTFRVEGDRATHQLQVYRSNSDYTLYLSDNADYTFVIEAEDHSGIRRIAWDLPTVYFEQHEFESAAVFVPLNGLLQKRRVYHDKRPERPHYSIKAGWRVTTWKPNIVLDGSTPRTVNITVENTDGAATEMQLQVELGARREGFEHH